MSTNGRAGTSSGGHTGRRKDLSN
ncbi:hypothetical protein GQ600_8188 [Phytophthora cactorum]|nr:hypothetical protein GQ600_8188 [Phytophthora cactorum]